MPHPTQPRRAFPRLLIAAVIAATAFLLLGAADRPAAALEPTPSALDGAWVHVGKPGDVGAIPRAGGRIKFRAGQRWTLTQADPTTGAVKQHFGGTCRVQGTDYTGTVDYSMHAKDPDLRKTLKFTVKLEGDTLTQIGVGNPYQEVWQRLR